MRVISGKFKGRRLAGTPQRGIRPTSDKLKETIFNILGGTIEGAVFLDACAGMGGIGIEAISRGARQVCFIEQSRKACGIIRANLKSLGIEDGFKVLEMELAKGLATLTAAFDIAFVDPPYDRIDLYEATLDRFGALGLVAPGGLLIFEHSKRHELPERRGMLRKTRSLVQGDAALAFYRPETT